jgi:hypothetical protein
MRERQRLADIRAQIEGYDELGDVPAVPRDFWPQPSARMPLFDDEPPPVPMTWRRHIGPVLLGLMLVGAVASCVFGGR